MTNPARGLLEEPRRCVRWVARRSTVPAWAAERVGAPSAADKLYWHRYGGDLTVFTLPPCPGFRQGAHVRMRCWGGRDQGIRATAEEGIGGFEPPLPVLLVAIARQRPGIIFDIGANTGFYSLLAVGAHPATRVYAIEPLPSVYELLNENLRLNRSIGRRVTTLPIAVGEYEGEGRLYIPPPTGQVIETSASLDPAFKGIASEVITVPVEPLDALWARTTTRPVTALKVDTEGTEHLVLSGARKLLADQRPLVICELLRDASYHVISRLAAELHYIDVRLRRTELVAGLPVEFEEGSLNHLLVPAESLTSLEPLSREIGLPLRVVGRPSPPAFAR